MEEMKTNTAPNQRNDSATRPRTQAPRVAARRINHILPTVPHWPEDWFIELMASWSINGTTWIARPEPRP